MINAKSKGFVIPLLEVVILFFVMIIIFISLSFFGISINDMVTLYSQYTFSILTSVINALFQLIVSAIQGIASGIGNIFSIIWHSVF